MVAYLDKLKRYYANISRSTSERKCVSLTNTSKGYGRPCKSTANSASRCNIEHSIALKPFVNAKIILGTTVYRKGRRT